MMRNCHSWDSIKSKSKQETVLKRKKIKLIKQLARLQKLKNIKAKYKQNNSKLLNYYFNFKLKIESVW